MLGVELGDPGFLRETFFFFGGGDDFCCFLVDFLVLPYLKLTFSHLIMDGWKTIRFLFGMAYFDSFRKGKTVELEVSY